MNDIHAIVENIYQDKRVNEFISKLKPVYLQADLKSHCICEIYRISNKYPDKIENLFYNNQLFAWFVGMAKMQLFSTRSTFYRLHRRSFEDDIHISHMSYQDQDYELPAINADKQSRADYVYQQLERPDSYREKKRKVTAAYLQADLFS